MTTTWTGEGQAAVFVAVDHHSAECVGLHAARRGTRFEALEPLRQGVRQHFGGFAKGVAAGLSLDELRLPRAIYTSSGREDVRHNLDLHALTGHFDAVVAAGDYASGKPTPDPFLRAAEVLGVAPETCLAWKIYTTGFVPLLPPECARS